MAESWMQGVLSAAIGELLKSGAVETSTLQLLNDIPNCDIDPAHPCSTGSVVSDTKNWFSVVQSLGI